MSQKTGKEILQETNIQEMITRAEHEAIVAEKDALIDKLSRERTALAYDKMYLIQDLKEAEKTLEFYSNNDCFKDVAEEALTNIRKRKK